jgi:hypothetical protein
MNRPAGVIVTAVLLFLAAAFLLLGMVLFYFSLQIAQSQQNASLAQLPPFMIYANLGFQFLLALWAAVTGVGLLKLKNWARVSLLLIAGTAVMVAATSALVLWFLPIPEVQGADPQFRRIVFAVVGVVFALPGAIGTWWLIYFTRPRVKAHFAGAVPADPGAQRPQSITLIAWLLLTSAPFAILVVPFGWPALFFGMTLRGWSAAAMYLFWGIAGTLAGYGLLKLKPWAYTLTLAYFLVGVVNGLVLYIIPGGFERWTKESSQIFHLPPPKTPPPLPPMWVFILLTLAFAAVLFYFLLTRRKRFLEAAAARAESR